MTGSGEAMTRNNEALTRHSEVPRSPDAQRRANLKLGWILATVALTFALGFVAKLVLFAR